MTKIEADVIIDCHTHAGAPDIANRERRFSPFEQSVHLLEEKMAQTGIWGAIVFPFPNTTFYDPQLYNRQKILRPSGKQAFPYQLENQQLVSECHGKNHLFPFTCIDPKHESEKQLDFLSSLMEQRSIFGLKFHGYAIQASPQDLIQAGFVDFAIKWNIPILFHSGTDEYSLPEKVLLLAKKFPKLRVSIAHFGQFKQNLLEQIPNYQNVFIDCCPSLYLLDMAKKGSKWVYEPNYIVPDSPVQTLLEYYHLLTSHLLWGTDEPWTRMVTPDGVVQSNHNYPEEVAVLRGLKQLSPQIVQNITHNNTLSFLFG